MLRTRFWVGSLAFLPAAEISYGTLAVRSFHLTTQHPHSRHEGEHKPIRAVSLCSLGKSVGSTLTLGTSSPIHVGPAGWCLVTATYGHAAASMNVFELQLLRRQLALISSMVFRRAPVRKVGLPDPFRLSTLPVSI